MPISTEQVWEELSREIGTLSRRLGTPLSGQQVRAFGIPQQVLSRMASEATRLPVSVATVLAIERYGACSRSYLPWSTSHAAW